MCILAGLDITPDTWDDKLSLTTIAAFTIMVLIDIRRLNDIEVSPWWLVLVWFLSQCTAPLDGSSQFGAYILLILVPLLIWGIFIIFKPGKALREARR